MQLSIDLAAAEVGGYRPLPSPLRLL